MVTATGPASPAPAHRYIALDSLRGLAALAVVLYHVQMRDGFAQWAPFCASNKFNDFFFVLSDFVNAASHGERLAASFSPARFLAWRLGRPYPLHSAMVLAGIVLECLALTAMVLGVAQCAWRWIKEPCCVWSRNNLRVAP